LFNGTLAGILGFTRGGLNLDNHLVRAGLNWRYGDTLIFSYRLLIRAGTELANRPALSLRENGTSVIFWSSSLSMTRPALAGQPTIHERVARYRRVRCTSEGRSPRLTTLKTRRQNPIRRDLPARLLADLKAKSALTLVTEVTLPDARAIPGEEPGTI
jgi:hypothetical protein